MALKQCEIEGCTHTIGPKSEHTICSLCRSNITKWAKRKPVEIAARRTKLHYWDNRMSLASRGRKK